MIGRLRALGSGIVFTRVWEDHEVDSAGLRIAKGDRVLTIASAGDKALNAALGGASQVVAVDVNPAQLHLVALKVAAVVALEWPDVWALFGVGRLPAARALYRESLRPALAQPARDYWDRHIGIFEVGLHGHNTLGLAITLVGRLVRLVAGPKGLAVIMEARDPRSQGAGYERRFRRRFFNPLTRRIAGGGILLRSVALNRQERKAMQAEDFLDGIEERVSRLMATALVRENPYWMPVVAGRVSRPEFETPWLRPENAEATANSAPALVLVRGSVIDALAARPARSLEAVELSNVPDWLPPDVLRRLWSELERVLVPGGRALFRSALHRGPRPPPDGRLLVEETLSAALTQRERTALYGSVTALRMRE